MTLHINEPTTSWGHVGKAAAVVEELGVRTALTVHDVDRNEIRVYPFRFEASWATERNGWECTSITIVGVPVVKSRHKDATDSVASHYEGPLAVSGALSRLPDIFRKWVDRNNPSRGVNR